MKILLVCDSTYYQASGGRVARYLAKILKNNNHKVKLVVISGKREDSEWDIFYKENEVEFIPLPNGVLNKIASIFFNTKVMQRYKKSLQLFLPDVVHFASFDNGKPTQFIKESKKIGAKVVLQPWTMAFYCAQNFGFRENTRCTLCASGNYLNAFKNKCISPKGMFSLMGRRYLQKVAQQADVFLSSNTELDEILVKYGISKNKIIRFPVPFDYTSLIPMEEAKVPKLDREKDYFIFYGQPTNFKGLNVLFEVFGKYVDKKLRIYPSPSLPVNTTTNNKIQILNNVNWLNGLGDAIADSKAVLVPSLWSTSTEYAMCEALLLKKPVILFNVGVHKDIFKNRFNAIMVEPNDIEGYAKGILELDSDEVLGKLIGEHGYDTLLEINNPDTLHTKLLAAYNLKTT